MKTLKQFSQISQQAGLNRGESAKQFAARNPQAAAKLSKFVKRHHAGLVAEIAGIVK